MVDRKGDHVPKSHASGADKADKDKTDKAALEHERLTSLINSMADGVIAVDEHLKVVLYNGAALSILNVNSSITGKSLASVFKPVDKAGTHVDVVQLVRQTTIPTATRDYLLHYTDGSKVNLYLSIAPVRLGYGQTGARGHVLLLRDITREKSLEEERDEFISVTSHELRTPITIAEGTLSNAIFLAQKQHMSPIIQKALKEAHDQILFLAAIINDLSTLSRAEQGTLTLEVEAINVHTLLHELGESYLADAKAKGLSLEVEQHPHLEVLHTSKLYLQEVLQNFITNAIKYTEEGGVTISAKPLPDGGVAFSVRDTGIGISKTDQQRVFDKFFRSEDYRTRKNSGTGLGLYVVSKLVKLLHAEITLDSQPNKGSTFTLRVPDLSPKK